MSARSKLLIIIFLLTLVAATASIYQLFSLRFEAGDVFPASSSLRADPQGTMAFYQSLQRIDGISVRRNYRPLIHQKITASTILLLGNDHRELVTVGKDEIAAIDQLVSAGNRVVVAFKPVTTAPASVPAPAPSPKTADTKTPKKPSTAWGVSPSYLPVSAANPDHAPVHGLLSDTSLPLPPEVRFLSRLTLVPPPAGWRVIYAAEGSGLLLERRIGNGSLVLVADSSLFSNEALKGGRQSALLAWLIGDSHTVVFDEAHLGVSEQGGIMALARRFGLLPLVGVFMVLAGLYLWQQSIPLPPESVLPPRDSVLGVSHDSFSGLVNLLRRNVPPAQILKVCCQEWTKSFSHELQHDDQLRAELKEAMAAQDDPVGHYQRIARLRAERTKR